MTWDDQAFEIAAEQYRWWRDNGFKFEDMIEAIPNHGGPENRSGDAIVCWLAMIWDGRHETDPDV